MRVVYSVDEVSEFYALDTHPYLEPEDIPEAVRYAAEAVRERELPLGVAG